MGTVGVVVLAPGYSLVDGPPPAEAAVALRVRSGLTPKSPEQMARALAGSWAATHVVWHDGPLARPARPAPRWWAWAG